MVFPRQLFTFCLEERAPLDTAPVGGGKTRDLIANYASRDEKGASNILYTLEAFRAPPSQGKGVSLQLKPFSPLEGKTFAKHTGKIFV